MGNSDYLKQGDWNAACSLCGRKRKASELVKNWQGAYRCKEHNEPRHPQDFVHGITEHPEVAWDQSPEYTYITFCTPNGMTAIADFAIADCALPDFVSPMFDSSVVD